MRQLDVTLYENKGADQNTQISCADQVFGWAGMNQIPMVQTSNLQSLDVESDTLATYAIPHFPGLNGITNWSPVHKCL